MAGRCYTELGKSKLAEPLLANAIAGYDHTLVRENSLYLSWLAEDYIQLNDLDQAASIATEALILASRTNSAHGRASSAPGQAPQAAQFRLQGRRVLGTLPKPHRLDRLPTCRFAVSSCLAPLDP